MNLQSAIECITPLFLPFPSYNIWRLQVYFETMERIPEDELYAIYIDKFNFAKHQSEAQNFIFDPVYNPNQTSTS